MVWGAVDIWLTFICVICFKFSEYHILLGRFILNQILVSFSHRQGSFLETRRELWWVNSCRWAPSRGKIFQTLCHCAVQARVCKWIIDGPPVEWEPVSWCWQLLTWPTLLRYSALNSDLVARHSSPSLDYGKSFSSNEGIKTNPGVSYTRACSTTHTCMWTCSWGSSSLLGWKRLKAAAGDNALMWKLSGRFIIIYQQDVTPICRGKCDLRKTIAWWRTVVHREHSPAAQEQDCVHYELLFFKVMFLSHFSGMRNSTVAFSNSKDLPKIKCKCVWNSIVCSLDHIL